MYILECLYKSTNSTFILEVEHSRKSKSIELRYVFEGIFNNFQPIFDIFFSTYFEFSSFFTFHFL